MRNALQKAVNSAQAEENEGEDDEESDEIIRKMRQQQISLLINYLIDYNNGYGK